MGYEQPVQLELGLDVEPRADNPKNALNDPAFAANKSLPVHRWVPWIAGFSSDFVRGVIQNHLLRPQGTLLDPFAGVGTTLVEGMLAGHSVIGFEINPYPYLVTRTKLHIRDIQPEMLEETMERFQRFYQHALQTARPPHSAPPSGFQSRVPFFSTAVLHKVLLIWDFISTLADPLIQDVFRIAFGSTMVSYSNYSYEPSLGTRSGSGKPDIEDAPVGDIILSKLRTILTDIRWHWQQTSDEKMGEARIVNDSFFNSEAHLPAESVDLIVTSPPYLNNYHYNRNTRPHLYWLGMVNRPGDFRPLEQANFGTYWQTARDQARIDLAFDMPHSDLPESIAALREINTHKGIYGGNGWANYAAAYFNDCLRFVQQTRRVLKPGGSAVVVIGNSILQGIMIPTDQYLAQIAPLGGLELISVEIPRPTRVGSSIIQSKVRAVKASSRHQLYEAVVTLRRI
jgi:DNA modification methylase